MTKVKGQVKGQGPDAAGSEHERAPAVLTKHCVRKIV